MSDAYYHRGLTIELDPSVPRLTIEGREIPAETLTALFDWSEPPDIRAAKLHKYGRDTIDRSPASRTREATRQSHLSILAKGVPKWNRWRTMNPAIRPLLYDSTLTRKSLGTDLDGADFANAVLINSNLGGQKLQKANFHEANLGRANLRDTDLTGANFCRADLYETDLPNALLDHANLQGAQLAKTNLEGAQLVGCTVYGMAAWDLKLHGAKQQDLIIRYRPNARQEAAQDEIIVDDLRAAHVVYLFLSNQGIGSVIDAMRSSAVLILGRFTPARKQILDALRDELRRCGFLPMLFDFQKPQNQDLTETVSTLAHLARFVVADLTDARSVPQELQRIVPDLPSLPVQPIILDSQREYSMFESLRRYPWVLETYRYTDAEHLVRSLGQAVITPANAKYEEMAERYARMEEALKQ